MAYETDATRSAEEEYFAEVGVAPNMLSDNLISPAATITSPHREQARVSR